MASFISAETKNEAEKWTRGGPWRKKKKAWGGNGGQVKPGSNKHWRRKGSCLCCLANINLGS